MHKEHINDPNKVDPGKYIVISSCFSIWWKNLFCVALQSACPSSKNEKQNTRTNPLCELLWMGPKNFENLSRNYF